MCSEGTPSVIHLGGSYAVFAPNRSLLVLSDGNDEEAVEVKCAIWLLLLQEEEEEEGEEGDEEQDGKDEEVDTTTAITTTNTRKILDKKL